MERRSEDNRLTSTRISDTNPNQARIVLFRNQLDLLASQVEVS